MLHPNKRREAIKQIAYEDGFYVFDKLKENLKKEKEKYNEAIQHCNKLEKKYKNMINNLIQENK